MAETTPPNLLPYARQVAFAPLGPAGQRRLAAGRVLIVGVGGLGSWTAELLARAGVGALRLVDADRVETTNLHRQALYDPADAAAGRPKALAAADHLRRIQPDLAVEPVVERLDAANAERLADGVDLILDGTDNFPTRFILNDLAVRTARPWVFAGVVGAEGQVMTIRPGTSACLRCVYDQPPPPCQDPTCESAGVLGPAVAVLSALQAVEALKLLAGCGQAALDCLLKLDLWGNTIQRIDTRRPRADCDCCARRHFEYLEP